MANDIDPITGLPPMQFDMPQSEKVKESLEERLETGAQGLIKPSSTYDLSQGPMDVTFWKWTSGGRTGSARYFKDTETLRTQADFENAYIRARNLYENRHRPTVSGIESEIEGERYYKNLMNQIQSRLSPTYTPEQAREKYKETGEGKLLTGALESFEKERELLGEISTLRGSAEREMALELQRRMEGIQEQGGVEREFIGQQQTQRGMLRSTFAGERIAESAQREQQLIGQERVGTQGRIMALRDAQTNLVQKIEQDREQLLLIRDIDEIKEVERKRNLMIESELRTSFQQAMAQAQISAAKKQAMMGTLTSLASTAMMAYAICWVARAIFGSKDMRWMYARTYVMEESPMWFYDWYLKNGEEFSKKVKKSKILKLILKPLFIYFAYRGKKLWSVQT